MALNLWIEELFDAIRIAEWGTADILGAVWDLCYLVDCGLVDGPTLDAALRSRCEQELLRVRKTRGIRRTPRNWQCQHHGNVEEAA